MEQPSWPYRFQRTVQRMGSLLVAAWVLWSLGVTATATSGQEAASTLWQTMALTALHWQLGDWAEGDTFSPATAVALSQSAFLEVARPTISALWSFEQGEDSPPEETEILEEKTPISETHTVQEPSTTFQDNGVEALTLTPSGSGDYLLCDDVYISATADVAVTAADILQPFAASLSDTGPQILIIHTHGTEAYTPVNPEDVIYSEPLRTLDTNYNVVAVGAAMADTFSAMGIEVIHDTTLYDYPSYNAAYDNALAGIEQHLAEYPSIAFVIDVHRDAIEDTDGNQYKLVTDPDQGTSVAQLTLVVGTDGGGLYHPDWLENLRLATAIGTALQAEYPTLLRPILLRNSRYNQHMTTGSLLLEVGSAGNSPEEAMAAGVLFAQEMGALLLGE
ncbi:stage II sporulation protein P [Bengtsoniella intestinalis]|uniref:stage II sporulation protein P n=1 Tax=Bengtsoniella intestinalis TaxID=3073143 RepID=UPI00391EF369